MSERSAVSAFSRRVFLQFGVAGLASSAFPMRRATAESTRPEYGPIEYTGNREDIPSFDIPPYRGERYEALVPDTLDIQERAALAVNGLTGPTDPEKDHLLYFNANFRTNPPHMCHRGADICQTKFEEALPLMRIASGSSLNDHIDPVWMEIALRQIGPDGLFYWPLYPWARVLDWSANYLSQEVRRPEEKHAAIPAFCGRRIGAMTLYRLRDPSGPWDTEIRKIVDGLRSIAIEKDDYAYFPQGEFYPNDPRVREAAMPVGIWSSLVGWTIQGLAQYHRVSGYEPAVDLAGRLARYLVYHGRYYGPDGEFLPNYAGEDGGRVPERDGVQGFEPGSVSWKNYIHFQHHMVPLLGTLDHALAVGDRDLAEFVRKAFEWGKTKGNTVVGYFPENIDHETPQMSEICEVAGMTGLALKLSAAGLGDYWDDADRWIRNQFSEGQLSKADWVYRLAASEPPIQLDPVIHTGDRVPERNIGAFAGWPSANDWLGRGPGIMHCCTGNATRALYYIWEHMLSYDQGTLSVNLLLNRPSPWADVHSHIPYTGQVDVAVKKPCKLCVRIPQWTQPGDVACDVNDQRRPLDWEGRYALIGQVQARDQVTVTFPIAERTIETEIERSPYTLVLRGNEVVGIDPPGEHCPLYQRDHYRTGETRRRKMTRFVSQEQIFW